MKVTVIIVVDVNIVLLSIPGRRGAVVCGAGVCLWGDSLCGMR